MQLLGYLFNWGLYGVLFVQVCQYFLSPSVFALNYEIQISTIELFTTTESYARSLLSGSLHLKPCKLPLWLMMHLLLMHQVLGVWLHLNTPTLHGYRCLFSVVLVSNSLQLFVLLTRSYS